MTKTQIGQDLRQDEIDLVYLWCDGSDPQFAARKDKCLAMLSNNKNEEAVGELRFFDNEELRYSLRSVAKHALWIHHIFIVTDRQVPKWLDLNNNKISIVDHTQIMPAQYLPCFNSTVIEAFLPMIPGLSERFLYANDDMFINADVSPEDFFVDGKPIVRVRKITKKKLQMYAKPGANTFYGRVYNSLKVLNQTYARHEYYETHHNVDAYLKSAFCATRERFIDIIASEFYNRFRQSGDYQRILFNLDMVYSRKAVLKVEPRQRLLTELLYLLRGVRWDSFCGEDTNPKTFRRIRLIKPLFFCINSGMNCDERNKIISRNFMEKIFPVPSEFEKKNSI